MDDSSTDIKVVDGANEMTDQHGGTSSGSGNPPFGSRSHRRIALVVCLMLAIVSFFLVAPKLENVNAYPGIAKSLDDKRISVIEVSATLAGLSVAVAAVPGDSTTPIAENIAQYSSYLIVVLGAIMLEKFLLPIMGLVTWRILIPLAFILLGIFMVVNKRFLLAMSVRFLFLGIALFSIIPIGIKLGDVIDDSFGMDAAIERIKTGAEEIDSEADATENNQTAETEESESWWDSLVNKGKEVVESVAGFGSKLWEKIKLLLGEIMDVIAAFVVSSCVIPIGIVFVLFAIVKGVSSAVLKYLPFGEKRKASEVPAER